MDEWVRVPGGYKRIGDGAVIQVDGDLAIGDTQGVSMEELKTLMRRAARDAEMDEKGEPDPDAY